MKESKIALFVMLIMFSVSSYAQLGDKLSLEVQLGTYGSKMGLFGPKINSPKKNVSFLNSFRIGYKYSERRSLFAQFRKHHTSSEVKLANSSTTDNAKGMEFVLGVEHFLTKDKSRKLSFSLSTGLFADIGKSTSQRWENGKQAYDGSGKSGYFGLSLEPRVHFRLSDRISILASTRYRLGWNKLQQSDENPGTAYRKASYLDGTFEPLHGISLKFKF